MAKKKPKAVADVRERIAQDFLDTISTLEGRQELAGEKGEPGSRAYNSEMRRLQRYTTKTGTQRRDLLKSPKVEELIEDVDDDELEDLVVEVTAVIHISGDKRKRPRKVRFELDAEDTRPFLFARTKKQQAEAIGNTEKYAQFRGAFIKVESVEVY